MTKDHSKLKGTSEFEIEIAVLIITKILFESSGENVFLNLDKVMENIHKRVLIIINSDKTTMILNDIIEEHKIKKIK